MHQLPRDFEIQTDRLISARRPDQMIAKKKENLQNIALCRSGGPEKN